MITTILSWLLYVSALVGLSAALGLAIVAGKARNSFYGHFGVGIGFAILAASLGYLIGNDTRSLQHTLAVFAIGMAGYTLLFFGRRRQREVDRFHRVINQARDKQSGPNSSPPQ